MSVTLKAPFLRCPLSDCEVIKVTAGGAITAGSVTLTASAILTIAATDASSGEQYARIVKAPRVVLPCAAAPTAGYPVGTIMYWDTADAELNTSSSGNRLCGYVTKAAVQDAETVEINFYGFGAIGG
jgi:predicted RecA/RadA family phage recombinase